MPDTEKCTQCGQGNQDVIQGENQHICVECFIGNVKKCFGDLYRAKKLNNEQALRLSEFFRPRGLWPN